MAFRRCYRLDSAPAAPTIRFPAPVPTPELSIVVVFHNMRREAPRTLFSLSAAYQRGVDPAAWEVIAVDNGSQEPLSEEMVCSFGPTFHYLRHQTENVSPASAINMAARQVRGERIAVCVDGARILSPCILDYTSKAFTAFTDPFVCTLGWHLGPEVQNLSVPKGYGPETEDALLESVNWKEDGYELFTIASMALSSRDGWFSPIAESNFATLSRRTFEALGGFDERFISPGGGLINLDFFDRACSHPSTDLVLLLGEGTFHQVHGGVATNVPMAEHPWDQFHEEYVHLRNRDWSPHVAAERPHYLGRVPAAARRFLPAIQP